MTDPTPEQALVLHLRQLAHGVLEDRDVPDVADDAADLIEQLDATARVNAMNMADYTAVRDQRNDAWDELHKARNELARLNGQTIRVLDITPQLANAWDEGFTAACEWVNGTRPDDTNPYRNGVSDD